MFHTFDATTADEAWQQVAGTFVSGIASRGQASRAGPTREILHVCISISDPIQRWVSSRRPAINVAFALAEVIWIIRGRNDAAFVNYFNNQLTKYAGHSLTYHGAYGYRLRSTFGIDQLDRARSALAGNPNSRQVVLQLWDATQDMPDENGREVSPDVPCNVTAFLKLREGRLEWLQVMRSNDAFRGLPYNLVQFTAVQEIMAGWLKVNVGGYHHISDSLHVYEDSLAGIEGAKPRSIARNSDSLALPKAESDAAFEILENVARGIAGNLSADGVLDAAMTTMLPPAFKNILCILAAEGLRRRKRRDLLERALACCTNAAYTDLYAAWLNRWRQREPLPL